MAGGSNRNEAWQGRVISIQPRIRLTRSFDERSHSDVGYGLRLDGTIGERGGSCPSSAPLGRARRVGASAVLSAATTPRRSWRIRPDQEGPPGGP